MPDGVLPEAYARLHRFGPEWGEDQLTELTRITGDNWPERLGQLPGMPAWDAAIAALRPATDPDDARAQLSDLVTAAIVAAYAPPPGTPRPAAVPAQDDPVAEAIDRAVNHGDEHVIKFTDTAAEVYSRTGDRRALAAAHHIVDLIR
jgi:hypothetical protein